MIPRFIDLGNLLVDDTHLQDSDLDRCCLSVLNQHFQIAIRQASDFDLQLINDSELRHLVWEKLLFELGISCTKFQLEDLKTRAVLHSKHPQQKFH